MDNAGKEVSAPRRRGRKKKPPPPDPARVEQVLRWLTAGHRDADILQSIAEHWPEQDRDTLLQAVADHLLDDGSLSRIRVIGWCYNATKDIYRRSLEIGDLAGALRAVKLLAGLAEKYGLDEPKPEGDAGVDSPR